MTRNFFTTITAAFALAAAACGDNKVEGETGSGTGSSSGDIATDSTSTTGTTPPTTGESGTTTGNSGTGSSTDAVTGTTGDTPTTGEATTTTTTTDPGTTTDEPGTTTTDPGTSTGNESGDPVQQCLMMIEPGDACGECACTNCTMELAACEMDEGCSEIRKCVQESGCSGQDCLGPCGATIAMYGGFMGESLGKAIALGDCVGASCADECGG